MPDYQHAETTAIDSVEDHDRFVLHSEGEIRSQLLNLAKKPDIITAYFNHGKTFLLTAVLGVLKDRNLLVLDVGPDDEITKKAIASDRLVCTTRSNGVPIKFSVEGLQSAKFQNKQAIAAKMPDSMFRKQRREFFRVQVPRINAPTCSIPQGAGEEPVVAQLLDISVGGLSCTVPSAILDPEIGTVYEHCRLTLPDFGQLTVNIEIRYKAMYRLSNKGDPIPRLGVVFRGLNQQGHLSLQRYIYHLQTFTG